MKINLQMFTTTGVFPVHDNVFKIGTQGRDSVAGDMKIVEDMVTFTVEIENEEDEWTPMDTSGWKRRLTTGKGLSISISGKRQYGDAGNDYIAGLILSLGNDSQTIFSWDLPNGDNLTMNCIVELNNPAGGDSTNVDNLDWVAKSDGLPVYTDSATLPTLTFTCTDHATAGATQVASVSPVLGGGNSYVYKVNGGLPVVGEDLTGDNWAAYTLTDAIPVVNGNTITLVEVDGSLLAVKGGQAAAVVA
jgi:hypothetical protein